MQTLGTKNKVENALVFFLFARQVFLKFECHFDKCNITPWNITIRVCTSYLLRRLGRGPTKRWQAGGGGYCLFFASKPHFVNWIEKGLYGNFGMQDGNFKCFFCFFTMTWLHLSNWANCQIKLFAWFCRFSNYLH